MYTKLKKGREVIMKKYSYMLWIMALLALLLTACGNQSDKTLANGESGYRSDIAVTDLKTAVADALGDAYWPETEIPAEYLDGTYGISADMYEEYLGEMPMMSTNVDTLVIVKAKEDSAAQVEEAMNAYRDMLVNDTMQYPMNVGKIQASRIETFGRYVCFVQLGGDTTAVMDENPDNEDDAVIAYCQEQNQIALDAIERVLTGN